MAIGSDGAGAQIERIWAENQHDSKSSRSVLAAFGRSLNLLINGLKVRFLPRSPSVFNNLPSCGSSLVGRVVEASRSSIPADSVAAKSVQFRGNYLAAAPSLDRGDTILQCHIYDYDVNHERQRGCVAVSDGASFVMPTGRLPPHFW